MGTIKAKHTVGDAIHVKLFYQDSRCSMTHYGEVTSVHLHHGSFFPDRVLYDIWLEQADAPCIKISDLPHGFVLAGGPPEEAEEHYIAEKDTLERMNEMCTKSLSPDLYESWRIISAALVSTRKAFKTI